MSKKVSSTHHNVSKKAKSSPVTKPGTGSGSRPTGGSTNTPISHPKDQHGLDGRKTKSALK